MSAILIGAKRWVISVVQEQFIVHYDCVLSLPIFFLSMSFLNGWSLLMNSVERFCVVAFPLYYYTHNKRIIFALIITQYAITAIAIIFTAVASLIESKRYISHFCMVPSVYSSYFYVTLTLMSSTASLFSIIVMVIVVALLKRRFKAQFLSKNSCNRDLTHFIKNQKRSPIIVMLCVYLPLLNSFNMVLLFIYRQKDLQNAAIYGIKWLLCRNKQHIQPATTAGFLE
uniref:G-protein coupled receptors family 1 profile domain-containing protein n=1 Tax=Wuchereria bancrofti TaxID=6293 RepID=A0A1I8EEG5_WUCBA